MQGWPVQLFLFICFALCSPTLAVHCAVWWGCISPGDPWWGGAAASGRVAVEGQPCAGARCLRATPSRTWDFRKTWFLCCSSPASVLHTYCVPWFRSRCLLQPHLPAPWPGFAPPHLTHTPPLQHLCTPSQGPQGFFP